MQCNKSLLIKPSRETLANMFGSDLDPKANYSFHVGLDDVHVIALVSDGDEIFSETRQIVAKEIMTAYIVKRYNIPECISSQVYTAKENTELVCRFLLKDASAIGNREPATSNADSGERSEAKAGATSGRTKGTRKKLPVLPSDVHPGVQGS